MGTHSGLQTEIHSTWALQRTTGYSTTASYTLFHVEDLIRNRHQNSEGRQPAGAGVSEERRAAILQQAAAAENVEAAQQYKNHSPSGS
jgi:hypothetical protein